MSGLEGEHGSKWHQSHIRAIWARVKIGLCNHIWSFLGIITLQFWHPRQAEIDGGFPKQSFVKLGILHYHRETHMYFWLFGVAGSIKIYWKTLCLESPYQTPENHATYAPWSATLETGGPLEPLPMSQLSRRLWEQINFLGWSMSIMRTWVNRKWESLPFGYLT